MKLNLKFNTNHSTVVRMGNVEKKVFKPKQRGIISNAQDTN